MRVGQKSRREIGEMEPDVGHLLDHWTLYRGLQLQCGNWSTIGREGSTEDAHHRPSGYTDARTHLSFRDWNQKETPSADYPMS